MELKGLNNLYRDAILDHCRRPRNLAPIEAPDASGHALNPFFGDEVNISLTLDNGRVSQVAVKAVGCSINQATASMLSEAIKGKTVAEITYLAEVFRGMIHGQDPSQAEKWSLLDLPELASVRDHPARIKCAVLAWTALDNITPTAAPASYTPDTPRQISAPDTAPPA